MRRDVDDSWPCSAGAARGSEAAGGEDSTAADRAVGVLSNFGAHREHDRATHYPDPVGACWSATVAPLAPDPRRGPACAAPAPKYDTYPYWGWRARLFLATLMPSRHRSTLRPGGAIPLRGRKGGTDHRGKHAAVDRSGAPRAPVRAGLHRLRPALRSPRPHGVRCRHPPARRLARGRVGRRAGLPRALARRARPWRQRRPLPPRPWRRADPRLRVPRAHDPPENVPLRRGRDCLDVGLGCWILRQGRQQIVRYAQVFDRVVLLPHRTRSVAHCTVGRTRPMNARQLALSSPTTPPSRPRCTEQRAPADVPPDHGQALVAGLLPDRARGDADQTRTAHAASLHAVPWPVSYRDPAERSCLAIRGVRSASPYVVWDDPCRSSPPVLRIARCGSGLVY